jgi:hypothetical protein
MDLALWSMTTCSKMVEQVGTTSIVIPLQESEAMVIRFAYLLTLSCGALLEIGSVKYDR